MKLKEQLQHSVSVVITCLLLMTSSLAMAAKAPSPQAFPLFDNLKVAPAKWTFQQELAFAQSLRLPVDQTVIKSFATPSGKLYFFGVVNMPHHHLLYVANRSTFTDLNKWRAYISDLSDFELIGHTLGIYTGPITVKVGSTGSRK